MDHELSEALREAEFALENLVRIVDRCNKIDESSLKSLHDKIAEMTAKLESEYFSKVKFVKNKRRSSSGYASDGYDALINGVVEAFVEKRSNYYNIRYITKSGLVSDSALSYFERSKNSAVKSFIRSVVRDRIYGKDF